MHFDWNIIADAAADVVDPSEIMSKVGGTGMQKPSGIELPSLNLPSVNLPKIPDLNLWGNWMTFLKTTLFKLHDVTGSYGVAIICMVLTVKALTYPLNYQVYASQFEMQAIQPEIDKIKEQYKDNQDLVNMRTGMLFAEKEVNPLAGCLPILIQFPLFIGLYRTLLNLGRDKVLDEPFLFVPSLEGPVVAGLPTDYVGVREDAPWLFQNWVNGAPPLGWHDTAVYLILPVMVVVAQLWSNELTKQGQPKKPAGSEGDGSVETLVAVLPYLIGWFALNLPAGCALYWVINTVSTTLVQMYIKSTLKMEYAGAEGYEPVTEVTFETEAERKIREQATEPSYIRGAKAAYKVFDDFLGMGLEDPDKMKPKDDGPSVLSKEFWVKDNAEKGALAQEEKDEVKAKFLAAREARKAKKAVQLAKAEAEKVETEA